MFPSCRKIHWSTVVRIQSFLSSGDSVAPAIKRSENPFFKTNQGDSCQEKSCDQVLNADHETIATKVKLAALQQWLALFGRGLSLKANVKPEKTKTLPLAHGNHSYKAFIQRIYNWIEIPQFFLKWKVIRASILFQAKNMNNIILWNETSPEAVSSLGVWN